MLLSANFENNAFQNAWNNFIEIVDWMSRTEILTLGDAHFTFLNVLVGLCAFGVISDVVWKILWGELGA